jgi:hypothetical protein
MATVQPPPSVMGHDQFNKTLSGVAWGLLFVWVGVAAAAQVGWGFGLLGVGAIILGAQVLHVLIGHLRIEWFSTVVGLLFLLGGIWELFSIQVALVPILCVVAGVVLIASALASRVAMR